VKGAWLWKDILASRLIEGLLQEYTVSPEAWRFQKPELIEFIRRQAASGELVNWTVALVDTDGKAGQLEITGCLAGKAERHPEEGSWAKPGPTPAIYRAPNANIQSPAHQALDLAELVVDHSLLEALLSKRADEHGAALFTQDEAELLRRCCAEGTTLREAAARLTLHRRPSAADGKGGTRINGEVARHLRPSTHGLLLIYPIVPTDDRWPRSETPFMGLALSFPSSHTARAVDYRVNRVWQDTFQDRDYADWN
jgi:hypothetical protein